MKQEVFVIGRELSALVPFSLAMTGPDYALTLVETPEPIERAIALSREHTAWFLLVLPEDESPEECLRLEELAPTSSLVLGKDEDPIVALAHLIAVSSWPAGQSQNEVASSAQAEESNG